MTSTYEHVTLIIFIIPHGTSGSTGWSSAARVTSGSAGEDPPPRTSQTTSTASTRTTAHAVAPDGGGDERSEVRVCERGHLHVRGGDKDRNA